MGRNYFDFIKDEKQKKECGSEKILLDIVMYEKLILRFNH